MKILHVTAYCSAFSVGGTEQYVDGLVDALQSVAPEATAQQEVEEREDDCGRPPEREDV